MPRSNKATAKAIRHNPELFSLEGRLKTAPCVPKLREAVDAWRGSNYNGATATTKYLLN
jgi:hypothetical protein